MSRNRTMWHLTITPLDEKARRFDELGSLLRPMNAGTAITASKTLKVIVGTSGDVTAVSAFLEEMGYKITDRRARIRSTRLRSLRKV